MDTNHQGIEGSPAQKSTKNTPKNPKNQDLGLEQIFKSQNQLDTVIFTVKNNKPQAITEKRKVRDL